MREQHRLRPLKMRVSRHDHVDVRFGEIEQHPLQPDHLHHRRRRRTQHVQPQVRRHLIVARPRRVQLSRNFADLLLQPRLDVRVYVLELRPQRKLAAIVFLEDLDQAPHDAIRVVGRDDALPPEHPSMRDGRSNVLRQHPRVDVDR